jgi:hypothetical protein
VPVGTDFALALAMQEAEQRELERITEYVRTHQHQKGACILVQLKSWTPLHDP